MKILALTSIRSEYDLLSPLLFKLHQDPDVELKLVVGGAHNASAFGKTYKDIENDGFDILCRVESLLDADSPSARLKSATILLMSVIDGVRDYGPDLILYAGDREEVLIGAMLGGYLGIPTLHFFGGDHAADGHIDNPVRHATSKLSSCHMVSTAEHRQRLLALGEPSHRIFTIGNIALDKFVQSPPLPDILKQVSGFSLAKPAALFIYHPIKDELGREAQIVNAALDALTEAGYHVFVGMPNSDPGNAAIRAELAAAAQNRQDVTLYGNLPRDEFVSLFKACGLIAGNSSAGLLEAASLPIPCVNIGARQRGRLSADNVIFVDATPEAIAAGIQKATSPGFAGSLKGLINPYGDGHSAERAYKVIKSTDFQALLLKKEDPLDAQS